MPCVLVADDSRPFAEMLRATFEDAGYEVVTAYSGLAAVAALEHNDISLAVLDVLMPEISGDAVAARLRQISPGPSRRADDRGRSGLRRSSFEVFPGDPRGERANQGRSKAARGEPAPTSSFAEVRRSGARPAPLRSLPVPARETP